ncbi:hypothetical protein J7T55_006184 [Diaporthe amygdali]|uniref:uncharacterized protein n=1 Tax=Phomopsis amygdali TaxID=1214568 RepID=UPI0022FEA557|nr:uncharacterized protein J7T55_006184 [Diaporthe amygdali]KAJ0124841.1 hypothetical protein J7T55_006184 [Diaporthe amygdali]
MSDRTPKVQACDGCRTRKVRCNGRQPCPQCEHFNLRCTFSPKKERTYGRRGRLVAQLRSGGSDHQKKPTSASSFLPLRPRDTDSREGTSQVASSSNASPREPRASAGRESPGAQSSTASQEPLSARLIEDSRALITPHANYTADYFLALIPDFENYTYPVNPIITSEQIRLSIDLASTNATHAALVYSFAAVTINLTMTQQQHTHKLSIDFINSNEFGMPTTTSERIHDLMNHSLRARQRAMPVDAFSDDLLSDKLIEIRIATCIFLEICWMAFKKHEQAFLILREAIAMIQLLHIDRGPGKLTEPEYARRRRIYWEAYIHERFLTITNCFPSILSPLRDRPMMADPSIPTNIDSGFKRIINLFLILDADLLANWMAQNDNTADPLNYIRLEHDGITVEWIEQKQQQLDDEEAEVEEEQQRLQGTPAALTELQLADLFITRAWMRTIVWQLAMSDFLLSSGPIGSERHEALSLFFPAQRLSAQLRKLAQFQLETSIGMHGSGILQKIFEIANTIADVMALFPVAPADTGGGEESGNFRNDRQKSLRIDQTQARQCMSDLLLLVKVLLSFERIDKTQRDIILSKVETLKTIFPGTDFENPPPAC